MDGGLNAYRDEAGAFLARIGAMDEEVDKRLRMLEEEFDILKATVNDQDQMRHQVYDMLFLLFEIAAQRCFDLDAEWNRGRERKEKKYLGVQDGRAS